MVVGKRLLACCFLLSSGCFLFTMTARLGSAKSEPLIDQRIVRLVVWTNQKAYSMQDALRVHTALQNDGDTRVYVDRRMFWTGFGGGLSLQIKNAKGKRLTTHLLSDAIMPPTQPGDSSILVPLEEGFFYGTSITLKASAVFRRPGIYSIRVVYKSWLRRELVAPELRSLPAVWDDSPEIVSDWITVNISR